MSSPSFSMFPAWLTRWLANRPLLSKVLANVGWLSADRLLRMGITLVVGTATLKYLGAEQNGIVGFASSMVMMGAALTLLAADNTVVRDATRTPERAAEIIGTGLVLRLAGAFFAFPIIVGIGWLMAGNEPLKVMVIAILAAGYFLQPTDVLDCWFQSQLKSRNLFWSRNIPFVLLTSAKIWLIWTKSSLLPFVWLTLGDALFNAASLVWSYRRYGGPWPLRFSAARARDIFQDSWPMLLSSGLINIYMRMDQVMLERMNGNEAAGIYNAAVRFVEVWYFIPMAIHGSILPSVTQVAHDPVALRERMQKLYRAMAMIGYLIAIPMTVAGFFLDRVLGPGYVGAGAMLSVFIWSILFTNLGVARTSFLSVKHWPRLHLATTVLGALVNLILNWWWIPRYAGMGAVWASLIAYSLQSIWSCFLFRELRETGFMQLRALVSPGIR